MFIGRRQDGSIYGSWTVKQPDDEFHTGVEELPDDHHDVVSFMSRQILEYVPSVKFSNQG